MNESVELRDIIGNTFNVNDETQYEVPTLSRDDENEYTKICSLAKTSTDSNTIRANPISNADRVDVPKPAIDATALKKVYLFCFILLTMIVILSVTTGVLAYTLVSLSNPCIMLPNRVTV